MLFEYHNLKQDFKKESVIEGEDEREARQLSERNRINKINGTVFEQYVNLLLTSTKSQNSEIYFQRRLRDLVNKYKDYYIIHFKKSSLYYIAQSPYQAIVKIRNHDISIKKTTCFRLDKIFSGKEENKKFDKIIIERLRNIGNRPDSVVIDGDKLFIIDSKFRSHKLNFSYADISNVLLYNDILKKERNIKTDNPPTIVFNINQPNNEEQTDKQEYMKPDKAVEYLFSKHVLLKADIDMLLKTRLGKEDKIIITTTDNDYTATSKVFGDFYKGKINRW